MQLYTVKVPLDQRHGGVRPAPGEIYYIQGSISMGFLAGRPNLAPSDAATFNSMKAKLKDSGAPKAGK